MRGFKSFKVADLSLPKDFVCLAGPNGSGKSNVCDAIRFAFGETSLRSLRVKKAKDLISNSAKVAEVTVFLDGDEKHEVKRAVREDGKMMYKLNGDKTTRTSIQSLLKKFNIDDSGRNVIAQGEINNIINMNPRDMRGIIDSVAGISEFEDKKKEAMGDLDTVESRIREANIILGEKLGMLGELEKEREIAIKYLENRALFNNARGSIIKNEMGRLSSDLEKAIGDLLKVGNSLKGKNADLAELDKKIKALEDEKGVFLNEIQLRQQKSDLSKSVDALRLSIVRAEDELAEKKQAGAKLETDIAALEKEFKKQAEELKKTEADFKKADEELNQIRPRREEFVKLAGVSSLRKSIEDEKSKLASSKEEFIRTESEASRCRELATEKESVSSAGPEDSDEAQAAKLTGEIELLKKEVLEAKAELESLFEREKSLNSDIADFDRKVLQSREQAAAVRAQNPHLSSAAIANFVGQSKFRQKGSGVHGALIDLIKFDAKYANAVEAAAGPRLRYIVVDSADVATKIIAELKKANEGRASFIPLREIRAAPPASSSEGLGSLMKFIKYDSQFDEAVKYALGETLLVSDMPEAKRIGVGKFRMVTIDGEIFEKSGVISGGRLSTGIAAASTLAKLDQELAELKSAREGIYLELAEMRNQMSSVRSAKADKEVRAKSLEMELAAMRTDSEKAKAQADEAQKKKVEAESLRSKAKALDAIKSEISRKIAELESKISAGQQALLKDEEQATKMNEEANRKHTELASRISALEAKHEGIFNEISMRKSAMRKSEESLKQMHLDKAGCSSKAAELDRKLRNDKEQLVKKEEELASSSKEMEQLFKKMRETEAKAQEIGKQRGAIAFECDKLNKEATTIGTKKTVAETKLADLKAEFDGFAQFEYMDKPKEELVEITKSADAFLSANQSVNLASIEIYAKKKLEIGDVNDKIKKLAEEKEAIMEMITEIDGRKKDTFFRMFYAVNDNFKKMFKYLPVLGEGYLSLNKPNEPFESGLYIKLKRDKKEIEMGSLSGGEKALVVVMLVFALQFVKPSPFYILDEADSALDKENSKHLAKLIKETSKDSQFIVVTHNDMVMTFANVVFGVSRAEGVSKIVGVKLGEKLEHHQESGPQNAAPS